MPLARPTRSPLALVAGLMLLAAPVLAADAVPARVSVTQPSSLYTALFLPSAPVHGLMAFLDAETGQITSASLPLMMPDDLRPQIPMDALFEVQMPNGSFMVDLQGTGEHFMTLHMDALGVSRHFGCTTHDHRAPAAKAAETHVLLPYAER